MYVDQLTFNLLYYIATFFYIPKTVRINHLICKNKFEKWY